MEPELETVKKYLKTFASGLKQRMVQFESQRGSFSTYLLALALMGLALWVRLAIAPVEAGLQYLTFFPAVALAAIVGGLWPGLFATAIGLLLATYIFTPPYYSFSSEVLRTSLWSNLVFLMDGVIVCSSIEAMHRYRSRHAVKLAEAQRQHEQSRQLQKEAEALLHRNRILMKNSADGIHVMDLRGNIVEANDAFCRMLGYTQEEAANLNVADWDAQWSVEELRQQFNELLDASAKFETVHRRKDGSLINVEINASGIKNEDQYFIVAASRDITERKRAEGTLKLNKTIIEMAYDGFWLFDTNGYLLDVNQSYANMIGYTRQELAGMHISRLSVRSNTPELVRARIENTMAHGVGHFETQHRHKDGHVVDFEASIAYIPEAHCLFSFIRDITERKKTEAMLRQHKLVLDTSIDGFWVCDMRGNLLEANEAYAQISGYTVEELVGMHISQLEALEPKPEDVQAHIAKVVSQGGYDRFETRHRHKDGHEIDIEVSVTCLVEAQRLYVFCRDITGRKQAEQALRDADRHKDEFLAMLAHELRNPLAPIRNAAHVIGRLGLAEPRVKWAQEIIERQVNHLTSMVDDLLDVSRIARGKIALKREAIEFVALARQVIESVRPLAENKGHSLEVRLPDQAVQMEGDPVRLSQLLLNLLDNAVKYTPDGGLIEFAARVEGAEIEISVRDNGMGIRAELLPRVFDLFQQDERKLDRAQGGLGIGLTLVRRLVEMHGGRVEARSAGPGQGSIFTVRLPVRAMPAPPPAPEAVSRPAAGVRVLVVDDDHAVADSTAVLLGMEGHEAHIAESGQAALEQVPEFRPQVVLLDIGLKGMDGLETAQQLRQLPEGRDLLLVALTGYADSAIRERALAAGCDHFLVKPVTFKELNKLLSGIAGAAPAHASI